MATFNTGYIILMIARGYLSLIIVGRMLICCKSLIFCVFWDFDATVTVTGEQPFGTLFKKYQEMDQQYKGVHGLTLQQYATNAAGCALERRTSKVIPAASMSTVAPPDSRISL